MHKQECENENPVAGSAAHGAKGIELGESATAITAAAVLVPRPKSQRHHIVGLRRNPRGIRHPWLVNFANLEFSISDHKLLRPKRFYAVAEHNAVTSPTLDVERFLAFASDQPCKFIWRDMIEHSLDLLRGGSS